MYEQHSFWDDYAEAMQASVEGNRLIARDIADGVRALWRITMRWLDDSVQGLGQRHHLPPI
jgi:hypothetical protein